jgi:putative ATP-dependent endonuclease of OLD family
MALAPERSRLVSLKIRNLGCIGPEGVEVQLDKIVCLVGRNNCGKSTVLRAYELAQGGKIISGHDKCAWAPENDHPEVELCVHIPDGTMNVDEKWKVISGDNKLVKSRWQWRAIGEKPIRQTWDPEAADGNGDWAEQEKAGGADNVFKSRLPQPLRVDSLVDSITEHDQLLKLIIEPIATKLRTLQQTQGTALQTAINELLKAVDLPLSEYQREVDKVGDSVHKRFADVFPELNIQIKLRMDNLTFDPVKELSAGSGVRFIQGDSETGIRQQGTGSRRALFWTLLQIRNQLQREEKLKRDEEKRHEQQASAISGLKTKIKAEEEKAKPNDGRLEKYKQELAALVAEPASSGDEASLPGFILLIDEPENALHPLAVRAACSQLYDLAEDPNWQVMLSTHSPYFINPLHDNTTILRIDRDGKTTRPRTFRAATAKFSDEDRENLRALLQLDASLAEMFFGSYPIVVEGDTEIASFWAALPPEKGQIEFFVVPARGKMLIPSIVRLLAHFKMNFGVLHDVDSPRHQGGGKNPAWAMNRNIAEAIWEARTQGVEIRHRVSVPDFERRLGWGEEGKDKPIRAHRKVKSDLKLQSEVEKLFGQLVTSSQAQPFPHVAPTATVDELLAAIELSVKSWAQTNAAQDPRYAFS